jgi:hypothetical protein
MSMAEILKYDEAAKANTTIVFQGVESISFEGMSEWLEADVREVVNAVRTRRSEDLNLVQKILDLEHSTELKQFFPGGWRELYGKLGLSDDSISQYWKIANVLARSVGMNTLRNSTISERRTFYEVALLAEDWQIKRDYTLEDASKDAITAAIGLSREHVVDLRKGRLTYDPTTRSSIGELGSVEKSIGKNLKKGLDELSKSAQLIGGEMGKAYPVSQDATLEMLASVLQNPANGWLRETLIEFAPTSQTPEEFIEILGKRIAISNTRAKSECSDEDIAVAIKAQMPQKSILQTFRIGTGRLNRVLELVKAGKL